jgi:rhamnopyranosyl-N-acetylglucosaminyl-diphospho-decaprenol beta-1,3/1,4-galactofuranosyltransferase
MSKGIAAVIVTYNRKELLVGCIFALLNQTKPVDGIYIIDNASTDSTPEFLKKNSIVPQAVDITKNNQAEIHSFVLSAAIPTQKIAMNYLRLQENIGGAGGFYEGVKRACEQGYDWFWLMDDDAEPRNNALELLLQYSGQENISALASLKLSADNTLQAKHRGYFCFNNFSSLLVRPIQLNEIEGKDFVEIDHASFVGILINRKAVEKIGYPKKEFFIHYDDVEFCIRLRSVGKILLVPRSIIIHKDNTTTNRTIKNLFWKPYEIVPFRKLWLRYYHTRNLVWLKKKYSRYRMKFYFGLSVHLVGEIVATLLYQDHKFKRTKFLIYRSVDGLRGNFDNQKPRRILYDE